MRWNQWLAIAIFVIGIPVIISGTNNDVEEFIETRPVSTKEAERFINGWNNTDSLAIPEGVYRYSKSSSRGSDSLDLDITYLFNDSRVMVQGSLTGTRLFFIPLSFEIQGEGEYVLDNGRIKYTQVSGDGLLFPISGTPYEVAQDGAVILYNVKDDGSFEKMILLKN